MKRVLCFIWFLSIIITITACDKKIKKNDYGELPDAIIECKFDENNFIISFVENWGNSENILSHYDIEYDDDYNIKRIYQQIASGDITIKCYYTVESYDDRGMPLKLKYYVDNSFEGWYEYKYADDGHYFNNKLEWEKSYDTSGCILSYTEYNEFGESHYEHYTSNGDIDGYRKYNEYGSIIESEEIWSGDAQKVQVFFEYYEDGVTPKKQTQNFYYLDGTINCYLITDYHPDGSAEQNNYHADGTKYHTIIYDTDGTILQTINY